jgi:hypothetical protein
MHTARVPADRMPCGDAHAQSEEALSDVVENRRVHPTEHASSVSRLVKSKQQANNVVAASASGSWEMGRKLIQGERPTHRNQRKGLHCAACCGRGNVQQRDEACYIGRSAKRTKVSYSFPRRESVNEANALKRARLCPGCPWPPPSSHPVTWLGHIPSPR